MCGGGVSSLAEVGFDSAAAAGSTENDVQRKAVCHGRGGLGAVSEIIF